MGFWKKVVAFFADDAEADEPDDAVRIFADGAKSEGARRAQIDVVTSLSDRLGSTPRANEKVRATGMWTDLSRCLADPTPWIREATLLGLKEIANFARHDLDPALLASTVPSIVACTNDPTPAVRERASWALASVRDVVDEATKARIIEALLLLTTDGDEAVRGNAIFYLGSIGAAARVHVARIHAALGDSSAKVRAHAALALWIVNAGAAPRPIVDRLIALLRTDPDADVRANAATALGRVAGDAAPEVVQVLVTAFSDPKSNVRHQAICSIGSLGAVAAPAIGPLTAMLDGSEHREAATFGLREIATPAAFDALRARGIPFG
jgi:HEAT repeat protein